MYGLRGVTIAAAALVFAAVAARPRRRCPNPDHRSADHARPMRRGALRLGVSRGRGVLRQARVRRDGTDADLTVLLDPQTRFELTVDGQAVPSALDLDVVGEPASKRYVTNFRFGMTGVHTLVGCWYAEGVLVQCGTRTITFTG